MKISGYITGDVPGLYVIIVQNDINSVQPVTGQVTMGWSSEFSKTTGALIFFCHLQIVEKKHLVESTLNHRHEDTQGMATEGTFIAAGGLLQQCGITEAGGGEDFKEEMANCIKSYKEVKANTY